MEPAREQHREHDAAYWDDRYAAGDGQRGDRPGHRLSGSPDPTVVDVVAGLQPGRALDLACGQGRHALHLAAQGWAVTAVDFSAVAIARAQAAERAQASPSALPVEWVVADGPGWAADQDASYDLVLCAFFHLAIEDYPSVRRLLAPGGRLVIVGHALRNLTAGVGGPRNPAHLHSEAQLRHAATGLTVERLDEVTRPTDEGDQIDLVLVAQRP